MIRIKPFQELFLLAGIGGALAAAIDFSVSGKGSLIATVASLGGSAFSLVSASPPLITILLAGVAAGLFGAASILYFRPLSGKGAFTCGFGAVGALAIFFP